MERLAWSPIEVSEATRIGRTEVYRAINAGELRSVKVGRKIVVPIKAVEEWLERRSTKVDA